MSNYIQKYIGSYVIVRTQMSGIYAGFLSSQEGSEVCLKSARMIYSWEGAGAEDCSGKSLAYAKKTKPPEIEKFWWEGFMIK